ncbi:thiamine pyrophosphate-binding protein [Pseudochelatococcus sp. B33]
MPTVGEFIVNSLVANGINRLFCVPGESHLALLDAMHGRDDFDTVVCRHEASAGFMALADARLTGRPGVALVSRGPGACNAAIAMHCAQQDAVPFILLIGQVPISDLRRDAFQEIDYGQMFGRIAKWTFELTNPQRAPEMMLRAIQVGRTGIPGPVAIALPEDVLPQAVAASAVLPQSPIRAAPDPRQLETLRQWLATSERPLIIAGSGFERTGGSAALMAMAESWNVPAVTSFRRQDMFPNRHPLYAGHMGLANPEHQMAAFRDADLLVVLGARLSDITTQNYTFPHLVQPEMRLVHVHSDPGVIGLHFAATLAVACDPITLCEALGTPQQRPSRDGWIRRLQQIREEIARPHVHAVDDGVPFETVVDVVGRNLPADAIVTVDAGTFAAPVYRIIPFRPPQRLLAPISGAMGYGVPAAVAASLRWPDRLVVCFVGDGGFLMTGNELTVAKERKLPLKVIVSENGSYASIRIQQELHYPGRPSGTHVTNPDFDVLGRAYGFGVHRIRTIADLDRMAEILKAPGPEFIVVDTSLKAVLPRHLEAIPA